MIKEIDYINVKNLVLLRTIAHCLQEMSVSDRMANINADIVRKIYGWILALEKKVGGK